MLAGFIAAGTLSSVRSSADGQPPAWVGSAGPQSGSDKLIALNSDRGDVQQVVLVDPQRRVMSVYHVDRQTGAISLKSVRNVQWDLLMDEYNGVKPLPREFRAILEQNK